MFNMNLVQYLSLISARLLTNPAVGLCWNINSRSVVVVTKN